MQKDLKNISELFFENSIDLLCIADVKGYFIKLNEEWEKTLGYSLSELEGKPFINFVHPDDIENTIKATEQLAKNTPVQNFRNRYRNKDGTYRWIEWRSRLYDDMIFATARDITKQVNTENALKESEERNRLITLSTTDYIFKLNVSPENKISLSYVSENFTSITGLNPEEIDNFEKGKTLFHPDDWQNFKVFIKEILTTAKPNEIECRTIIRENIRWVNISITPITDESGRVVSCYGAVKDITEKKNVEEELAKTNKTLNVIIETVPIALMDMDTNGYIKSIWNPAAEKIFGWKKQEVIGKYLPTVPEEKKEEFEKSLSIQRKGQAINGTEVDRIKKNGESISYSIYSAPIFDNGKVKGNIAALVEKKSIHQELEESEKLLKGIAQNIPGVVFQFRVDKDGKYGFNFISENSKQYLNLDNKSYNTFFDRFVKKLPKKDQQRFISSVNKVIETFTSWKYEGKFYFSKGKEKYIRGMSEPKMIDDELIFDGIIVDITEQKKTEEEFLKTAREKEMLLKSMANAFVMWEPVINDNNEVIDVRFSYINEAYERIAGFKHEQVVGKRILEVWPETGHQWFDIFSEIIKTGKSKSFEMFFKPTNALYFCNAYLPWDTPDRICVVFEDITERKKSEEELIKSQRLLIESQKAANIGSWEYIIDEDKLIWNEQTYNIYGIKDKSLKPNFKTSSDLTHPDDRKYVEEKYLNSIKSNLVSEYEYRIVRPDNTIRNVRVIGKVDYKNNKPYRTYGIIQGITERKKEEETLLKNQKMLTDSQRIARMGSWELNLITTKLYWNKEAFHIYGYKYQEIEPDLDYFFQMLHPDDIKLVEKHFASTLETKKFEDFECRIIQPNGIAKVIIVAGEVSLDDNGKPVRMYGIVQDITERKKEEETLLKNQKLLTDSQRITHTGSWEIDLSRQSFYLNNQSLKIYGLEDTGAPITLNTFWSLVLPEDVHIAKNHFDETLRIKKFNDFECRIKRPDGIIITIRIVGELVLNDKRDPVRMFGIVQDITKQKKAEEELRRSQKLLTESQRIAQIGCFENDFVSKKLIWNEETYKIFGYDYQEIDLTIDMYKKLIHRDDLPYVISAHKEAVQTKTHKDYEYRIIRKDGEVRTVLVVGDVELNNKNEVCRTFGIIQDITEQKKIEIERLDNIKFLESLDKVNRAIQGAKDLEQMMKDAMDVILSIFNCDRAFLLFPNDPETPAWEISMECTSPGHPGIFEQGKTMPTDQTMKHLFVELLKTQEPIEYKIDPQKEPWKQFNIKSLLAITLHPLYGKAWQLGMHQCSYNREWTKQEKILFKEISRRLTDGLSSLLFHRNLKSNEEFLNKIVDNIPNMIFVKDSEALNLVRINKAGEQLLGYSQNELLGKNDHDFFTDKEANFFTEKDREVLKTKKLIDIPEEILTNKKNEKRILHTRKMPILDENGNPKYLLGISEDITDRINAQKEIEKLNAELEAKVIERTSQLEQANKDLEAFAYSVSHDLRAPLRHIDGFANMMYSRIPSPGENITEYYKKINMASNRMSSMIDELLTFSRLGRKDLKLAPVDLNTLVREVIEQFKPDFVNRNIKWIIQKLPVVNGDKTLLRISLENIISNAIKYTSKKTKAIIEIGTKQVVNNKVTIYFKDNGAGFDMNYATKLFGVFQRLHPNEEFEGIGIGLANVKQIINKHMGNITAESKVNEGSTFYITLPK